MDSAHAHGAGFYEAISFMVHCRDQAEQCGWCKDRYGLSWQVSPEVLDELMTSGAPATVDRVTQAFLGMKKLDVAAIEAAAREV